MDPNSGFELLARNVPHILEKIFLALDYETFKNSHLVCKAWNKMLSSDTFLEKSSWCSIAYFELDTQVGGTHRVHSDCPVVKVDISSDKQDLGEAKGDEEAWDEKDAYSDNDNDSGPRVFRCPNTTTDEQLSGQVARFCLGPLTNAHRTAASVKTRRYIGRGIELEIKGEGNVWIRSVSRELYQ